MIPTFKPTTFGFTAPKDVPAAGSTSDAAPAAAAKKPAAATGGFGMFGSPASTSQGFTFSKPASSAAPSEAFKAPTSSQGFGFGGGAASPSAGAGAPSPPAFASASPFGKTTTSAAAAPAAAASSAPATASGFGAAFGASSGLSASTVASLAEGVKSSMMPRSSTGFTTSTAAAAFPTPIPAAAAAKRPAIPSGSILHEEAGVIDPNASLLKRHAALHRLTSAVDAVAARHYVAQQKQKMLDDMESALDRLEAQRTTTAQDMARVQASCQLLQGSTGPHPRMAPGSAGQNMELVAAYRANAESMTRLYNKHLARLEAMLEQLRAMSAEA